MNRRLAVGGVAVVTVVGLGAWALLDGDGDDGGLPPVGTLALPDDDLGVGSAGDPAADELDSLLATGRAGVVHAVYESEGDTTELGGDLRIELWRSDGRARYDNRFETATGVADTVVIVDAGTTRACNRVDGAPFTCDESAEEVGPDVLLPGASLAGRDVAAYDDVVGGVDARCFRVDDDLGRAAICFDVDGIPLLLTSGDARLVRVQLDDDVTDADFELPV